MLCGNNCYYNKDKAPAEGQLWCFVLLMSPRTRVLFRLSKTERTTHMWEDLWNPPQLSTGPATLFREPQVVRVFTIWSIRIRMLLKMRGYNLGGAYRFAARGVYRMWKEGNHMSVPPEAVHATFGPATELRPDTRRGLVSDGWLPIQCCSEGKGRVEISLPLWLVR